MHPDTAWSANDFLKIIEKNLLKDRGTTQKNILIAEDIFGPRTSGLKEMTTITSTAQIWEENITVPDEILDNYKDVCLGVDILFINRIPFFAIIPRHLYVTTVKTILNVEAKTLLKSLKGVFAHYPNHRFNIQMCTGLTFGDVTSKTTIRVITTTENSDNDGASDGDYSVESDFTEIFLTDTLVDAIIFISRK